MRTMARECPAVVKSPLYLHAWARFDPFEEEFVVDVVSMNIMKPEDIWIIFFSPL
jgi:hypothetical protein